MRLWPFGGKDKGADDLARDRDEQFEDETEDGFEGDDANDDEEQVDDLSDLDAEVKARVDKALAAKETAFAATLRARDDALGELGMGFMSDGRPAIRDPQKVAAWAGAPAREAPAAPKAQAEEEEEEEIDVYDLDGKKLSQIVDRRAAKLLEKRLAQYEERFQQQDQLLRGYEARDAVGRAQDAIRQSVPHLADFIDHPDFAESFRRVAATVSPQQLQDPTVLVMLAGSAVTLLDPAKVQAKPRDTKGRFAPDQAMQSTLSRRGLASVAPSREGGTGQATKAQDEEERLALSRFMGYEVSADRFAAAKHDNYDDWKAARTAAAKKR
jgi:hypothetical protein